MNNTTLKTAFAALALTALLASMPLASANLAPAKLDLKDVIGPDDGCHEGEPVADCAIRVTYEFAWTVVGPIYYAAEEYCDDLTSLCPMLASFENNNAAAADVRLAILDFIEKNGCREGEPVIDCAVRVTYEFVWAIVGPVVVAVIEYCKDLTSLCHFYLETNSASAAKINVLEIIEKSGGCREGEPVIDCALRVTFEFVWAVVGPIIVATAKLCRDLTSWCPLIAIDDINHPYA